MLLQAVKHEALIKRVRGRKFARQVVVERGTASDKFMASSMLTVGRGGYVEIGSE